MTFTPTKKAMLSALLFFNVSFVFAAPVNDECASATLLTQTTTCSYSSGTTASATPSAFASSCGGTADDDVWYKFVATGTTANITVQGSSSFDAVVELLASCGGTSLSCADQTTSGGKEIIAATGLTNGQTYFIRVYHYYSTVATTPTFSVCVSNVATPANDDCSKAYSLNQSTTCSTTNGTTFGATPSSVTTSCLNGTGDDDVWYKFVATSTNTTIQVQGGTNFDAVVQVFNYCGGTTLYCMDNTLGGGTETISTTGLTEGQSYFVRVYDYGTGSSITSTFTICLTAPLPAAPANDNCANAISVGGSFCSTITGTTAGATTSAFASSCNGTANDDVWYKFVASGPDAFVRVQGLSNFDAVVEVLNGCTGTSLQCSDVTAGNGLESFYMNSLTSGNTYFIRVYDYNSNDAYSNSFSICVSNQAPLVNDDCAGAIALPVTNSKNNLTSGTTSGATQSSSDCAGYSDDDVWYKFVASSPKDSIYVIGASFFDAVVGVYDACDGAYLYCVDNTNSGEAENSYTTGLITGNTYYFRVFHFSSTASTTPTFQVAVYDGSIVTGVSHATATEKIAFYPNPAVSEINLDLSSHKSETTIQFFDVQGKLVKQEKAENGTNVLINIQSLLDGIYSLRIVSEGLISTGKLVVVK